MTSKLLMENYLLIIKSTIEVYIHGTLESSNSDVRKLLQNGLNETLDHQQRIYNEMVKNNWYVIDNVNESEIIKVINKINNN